MFTLRIDSGPGIHGYRATVYGPGLPTGEPKRDMDSVIADIQRAMVEARKMGPLPKHVFGETKRVQIDLSNRRKP